MSGWSWKQPWVRKEKMGRGTDAGREEGKVGMKGGTEIDGRVTTIEGSGK
jgi:hypothetical protein